MRLSRKRFEDLVWQAVEELPSALRDRIHNVEIEVRWAPNGADFEVADDDTDDLFGLYHGIPLPERTSDYHLIVPDVITIFQRAHEDECQTLSCIQEEIRRTVRHEIAHYFGIDDSRLDEIGRY